MTPSSPSRPRSPAPGGTSTAERTTRDRGQPGVRLRMYSDPRQVLKEASPVKRAPATEDMVCHHGGGGCVCVHGATSARRAVFETKSPAGRRRDGPLGVRTARRAQ
ncbi:DUF6207 family protein [Streptomyces sp. NPDC054834]